MKNLFIKELKLAASPLTFFFIAGAFITFIPGYPLLVGTFFVTLGIFYSFRNIRENGDINYSVLLPVSKRDIVKGKFCFVVFLEGCAFLLTAVITLIRILFLSGAGVYAGNPLMCANFTFLGYVLIAFALFNLIFVGGFFKTGYYFGKPFFIYLAAVFLFITAAETLFHLPYLGKLNSFGFENIGIQSAVFAFGAVIFILLTLLSVKRSEKTFLSTDL